MCENRYGVDIYDPADIVSDGKGGVKVRDGAVPVRRECRDCGQELPLDFDCLGVPRLTSEQLAKAAERKAKQAAAAPVTAAKGAGH